jgi:hypothetical protein
VSKDIADAEDNFAFDKRTGLPGRHFHSRHGDPFLVMAFKAGEVLSRPILSRRLPTRSATAAVYCNSSD